MDIYNGVLLFDHKPIQVTLQLDASLTGFGRMLGENFVYNLPMPSGYKQMSIVHLATGIENRKVLIRCENQDVVLVLKSGRTCDLFLAACARSVWYLAATADIDLNYTYVRCKNNCTADLLSRWTDSFADINELHVS